VSGHPAEPRTPFSVVLADANVWFSRVVHEYILHSAARQIIRVRWSKEILDETVGTL